MAPPDNSGDASALRDYLLVLRRRKWVIIFCVAVVTLVALALSLFTTPVYEGTAEILLQPEGNQTVLDTGPRQVTDPGRAVQTQIRLLQSAPVQAEVRAQLGKVPPVAVIPAGQTDIIEVQAQSTSAKRAADVANAYANAYIKIRQKQAVNDTLAAAEQVQAKIDDLQKQIDSFDNQMNNAPQGQQQTVRDSVTPQRDAVVQQRGVFKSQLDKLQVDAALQSGGAQLTSQASTPTTPVAPKPVRSGVLAAVLGCLLGVGAAFLVDHLDDSVKTKDDLSKVVPEKPVIGLIPIVEGWRTDEAPKLVSIEEPTSAAAEAYRTLRTSIQFIALDRPVRTLHVTSPGPQEGKSTTLANLGVALARAGQRVIIVCCDLRRPRIHEFFGLNNDIGFTSVLLGRVPLTSALQQVPGQIRLSILASGPLPPNPSELLSSPRVTELIISLHAEADIVLIDSPPILPVADALVLSGQVDATILVCVSGATTRKDAARAVELLQQVDAPLVGTVLNGVSAANTYGYGGEYYRYIPGGQVPPSTSSRSGDDERGQRRSGTEQQPAEQP